jgi:hypothetical protein
MYYDISHSKENPIYVFPEKKLRSFNSRNISFEFSV